MIKRPHIKVCGMKHTGNLEEVCALGPDYVGFIFVEESPRFVGHDPDPALFRIPGMDMERVGVFVDKNEGVILEQLEKNRIDLVQLHGSESPDYCRKLKDQDLRIIKALPSASLASAGGLDDWVGAADFLLLDSPLAGQGGSGKKFDWEILKQTEMPLPFFLSGGITRDDAGSIRKLEHPGLFAVDVNSGFEREPGLKDAAKLEGFIKEIRSR